MKSVLIYRPNEHTLFPNDPLHKGANVLMDGKSPLPKPRLIDRLRAWWNGWSIN